ncbi:hypothetical protein H6F92_23105 [Microcystis wesenbergii FACHB-1317]|uniref:hypothetical protein n=1 Tax=Microcystis TaxID=1125 RepID=UPI000E39C5AB|nr:MULTISPECIES: hypothetical protein [Microcystis]MBD2291508.1 hypothetical protein [Microcystis wesenbergii FACHB-1317]REJ42385.1 MAG: hypothetical protein DWQ58_24490 [Microcystis aeruginosa TA09]UZO74705.1 hypothetical protein M8120_17720 [Microcystis aeruginosa str. Chao 1910]
MVKSTLYTTAKVLPGNRIEIESPDLTVGQTVEVVILVEEVSSDSSTTEDIAILGAMRYNRKQIDK